MSLRVNYFHGIGLAIKTNLKKKSKSKNLKSLKDLKLKNKFTQSALLPKSNHKIGKWEELV